jgi:two-component system, cell cycle sensor histidine kinase and response regulator CckA
MASDRADLAGLAHVQADLQYQALFEWAASGMAVTSLEGRFLVANPALCRMLGYTEEELRERDFFAITHPEDRARNKRLHRQLLSGEVPSFVLEKRYLRQDAAVVWGRVSAALIRDSDGTPLYVATTIEDITDHKRAAEQLGLSQTLLRVAGRMAKVGGWALDVPTREVFWSDEIFEILDAPDGAQPTLEEIWTLYPRRERRRLQAAIDACAERGTPFDVEVEGSTFTGRARWFRVVGEPERAADGTITRVTGAFQDVSELRAAHARTDEVAERLTTSLENMTDAVYLLDRDWRFTYLNSRAAELVLRDRDELLGRSIWEAFPDTRDYPVYEAFHRAVRDGTAVTLEEMYYAPLDSWFAQRVYPSDQGLAVYFRDVTEEHDARVALEQRGAKLTEQAALLDETQEAIFVQDLEGAVTYWNRSAQRIYGYSPDEALGRPAVELVAGDPSQHAAAVRAVSAEGTWGGELRHVTHDGGELIIEARLTLLRDDTGAPRSILATHTDVTAARRMERQLIRSQRIESLGTLAGGIAHDLNNALAPIFLAVDLLTDELTEPRQRDLLAMIEGNARRGAAMVRQVLAFARGVEGEPVDLDATQVFTDVLRVAAETFRRDIRFSIEFSPMAGWVRGDETQLHQVLMNLLLNARDAMPDGGNITCSVYDQDVQGLDGEDPSGLQPGHHVVLQVTDEGHGMSPEVADRIFEPFFTTKSHGEGTGLGLSTSLAIIEGHGGQVEVDSAPGKGTTVRVLLPTLADHDATAASEPRARPRAGEGELVLVVDDEPGVRTMMQRTLQEGGYRVLCACTGDEAVAAFRLRHDDIAVVITDLMMPGMPSSAAIDALRGIDPSVPVIAASGLAEPPRGGDGALAVEDVLAKPFSAAQLLDATRRALDDDA